MTCTTTLLLPMNLSFGDALTIAVTLEQPCFTHTTALTQQLPILNGLTSNAHIRNSRPLSQPKSQVPPIPSSPFSLSSNSSDLEEHAYIHQNHQKTMSLLATVEPTSTKAPILTEGDISLAVMMDFENAALDFFSTLQCPTYSCRNLVIPVEFCWNSTGIKQTKVEYCT